MLRSSSNRNTHTNVGAARPFTKLAAGASTGDYEDKYRRATEENTQLKKERNELEEKLKELKTKFRRLTRDLVPDENGDYVLGTAGGNGGKAPATPHHHNNVSLTGSPAGSTAAGSKSAFVRKASMGDSLSAQPGSVHNVGQHSQHSFQHPHPQQQINPAVESLRVHLVEEEKRRLEEKLKFAQQQIEYFTQEMNRMKTSTPQGESASQLVSQLQLLQQQLEGARTTKVMDDQRITSLQRERDILHADVQNLSNQLKAAELGKSQQQGLASSAAANAISTEHYRKQVQDLMADLQKNRDQQLADLQTIDTLTRERDRLKVQLSLTNTAGNPNTSLSQLPQGATAVDTQSLTDLQRSLSEKGTQITVLTNRMNFAQGQAEAMRTECERLVEELKALNHQHAEVKRTMFQLEHEKASLLLRCEKVATLESSLDLKSQELIRSEQELLRCVDRLQSCSRDTELQVRRELGDRMGELESMRDKAEADRRANEREVLASKLEVSDYKRRLENALHDAELYKREVQRLDAEKKELMDRVAMGGAGIGGSGGLNIEDDEVHRAVALATMRKRAAGGLPLGGGTSNGQSLSGMLAGANNTASNATANEVMAMWEGMEWSDGKELSLLRETLAATAVDMELAETRCTQLQQALNDKKSLLDGISAERDELLGENIELRHRISGVQTALARAQLQKITAAQNHLTNVAAKTSLIVALNSIECDPVFQQCDDGSTYTPTLFFTLDLEGLEGYEPILSDTFFSLNSTLSVQFVFGDIDPQEVTLAKLQKTNFVLQLHQSFGTESCIVATATLNGSRLLHCRYDGVHSDHLALFTLEGERMGSVDITITAPDLLLPIFLARPLVSAVTPDSIRAALIAFRSVRGLRIQVFRANNLANNSQTQSPPSPYVYYTSTSPHGITFVADTMVTTSGRMITNNPTFDVLPTDHSIVLDAEFVRFMSDGCLSFVVFDHKAVDIRDNIGLAVIPLKGMLTSPTTVIQRTESLHPQGTIEIGISWIRSAE